jgi:hypothetical protein
MALIGKRAEERSVKNGKAKARVALMVLLITFVGFKNITNGTEFIFKLGWRNFI